MRIFALAFLFFLSFHVQAQTCEVPQESRVSKALTHFHHTKHERLVAIGLNVSLGMLGVHRMYLGTEVKVPVAYACTVGGIGVLWVTDLVILVGTKDYESLKNNPHVFLWNHD